MRVRLHLYLSGRLLLVSSQPLDVTEGYLSLYGDVIVFLIDQETEKLATQIK